jgi:hypothetical protein
LTQLTEKAYEAMGEGPFAKSALDIVFVPKTTWEVEQKVLELHKKLVDRVRENGKKFLWKKPCLRPVLDNLCSDFI